ncbi:hypothetical protein DYB30_010669 [Aphanomyces astaci]|uniref:Queuosine 5'-phosphate N-glycosylase/hydrolase n=2 Tax=Aphanomyces astaci TaxID=112090 RepID=A0A397DZL4_APHAT|nr:hypothetical protein DYB30_010669 [Aphanomyces astaci]
MGPNSTLRYTPANVRDSCTAYMQHQAKHVTINEANIATFVAGLDRSQFDKLGEPIRYPLSFKSVDEEVNFLGNPRDGTWYVRLNVLMLVALVDLLNFGSGYRKLLHQYCDRVGHMFGVIGMYISSPRLDAKTLRGLSLDSVANYFSIPLDRDEELSTGIYISKPHGFDDLGAFVLAHVHETAAPSTDEALHVGPSAAALVDALAATFPGFCDVHNDVIILKKAQLLASNLYRRFGASDVRFAFQDMETLTACSDNVLPCVLHALGILEYTPALAAAIEDGQVLVLGSDEEVELRAGAVVACDKILAVLQEGDIPDATILALDSYLWRVGKLL